MVLLIGGCTINISQQTNIGASTPPAVIGSTMPTMISEGAWANLNLTGKLIFVVETSDATNVFMEVEELDLRSGSTSVILKADQYGYIDSAVVSPDHKQIVMSYSPPSLQQGANFTPQALFILPIDGSQPPQQLFPLPLKDDQEFEPVWSPDGKYIYFVLANYGLPPEEPNQHYPIDQIYRAAYPGGQPEKILDKAYWPRLSADGSSLIYVSENPDDGTNKLFVANTDGSNPRQIVLSGANAPNIIDAPMFLPDGKTILFSAPSPRSLRRPPGWIGSRG